MPALLPNRVPEDRVGGHSEAGFPAWIVGVGAGDAQTVLEDTYRLHRPDWAPEDRHRPHQQYLSLVLALSLVGLILGSGPSGKRGGGEKLGRRCSCSF